MDCRDDRAEIGFTRVFLEGVPYQWIRSTENKCPGGFKIKRGREHICEYSGLSAGVVKLADARDSKSRGSNPVGGSIPPSGTN